MKVDKVLLVDDDSISNFINRSIIEEILTPDIEVAENGLEALEILKACISHDNCPHLIFLDINMPVMNGFEFLEALDKLRTKPDLKVIVLTSSRAIRDLNQASAYSILGYICKPLTVNKLAPFLEINPS
jgi:CheY-like chemotaxis protein